MYSAIPRDLLDYHILQYLPLEISIDFARYTRIYDSMIHSRLNKLVYASGTIESSQLLDIINLMLPLQSLQRFFVKINYRRVLELKLSSEKAYVGMTTDRWWHVSHIISRKWGNILGYIVDSTTKGKLGLDECLLTIRDRDIDFVVKNAREYLLSKKYLVRNSGNHIKIIKKLFQSTNDWRFLLNFIEKVVRIDVHDNDNNHMKIIHAYETWLERHHILTPYMVSLMDGKKVNHDFVQHLSRYGTIITNGNYLERHLCSAMGEANNVMLLLSLLHNRWSWGRYV